MSRLAALIRRPRWRVALVALASAAGLLLWVRLGPIAPDLLDLSDATSTVVVDRRGVPLYEALSGDETRGTLIAPDRIPPLFAAATVAAEDRRFRSHPGIDPVAIVRAMRRNLAEGTIVEGGSTITQQAAKLLLARRGASRSRGWSAKLREAVLALRLEHRYTKDEILALYLSLASYGNQIVGAERAGRTYFDRDLAMLTPAQAAFVAGLPQRPTTFNPYRNPSSAIARQRTILARMEGAAALTLEQAAAARDEELVFSAIERAFLAPHLVARVLASAPGPRPARIETTIDAGLQADVAGIIRSHRAALLHHGARNVAVVVLDNRRGEWLAYEGSGDYTDSLHGGAIDGVTSARQPGSALKPFTYALGFEQGYTPASVLADIPSQFPTAETGVLYSPRNYDGRYRGPLLARAALAGSENVPAVALASELGVPSLLRFLQRAGLTTFDRNAAYYGLGVTLGNAEVRLDELVAAYAAFPRGGEWIAPTWRLNDPQVRERRRLVSPRAAYWITDILSDGDARAYIFGRGGSLELPFPVAVKTGTSQAYHDNWTIGYSRDVTVGVWVGNFDRTPLRDSSGVTGAGPIFHAVMLAAQRRVADGAAPVVTSAAESPIVEAPAELVERDVCALSGLPANPWCPAQRRERLPRGAADEPPCAWHHLAEEGVLTVWPGRYREWARRQGLVDDRAPAARPVVVRAVREGSATARGLSISSPASGSTYLLDPTLRREFQALPLRATTDAAGPVEWRVDGRRVGAAPADAAIEWPLAVGTHVITARDAAGRTAEAHVVVR